MSKKHDHLFGKIINLENVDNAYKKTQAARLKYKYSALKFSENVTANLDDLISRVESGRYVPGGYHSFYVYEPKKRLIFAPCFEDKIVQHMLNNILKDIYQPCFIYDSYACLENKGSHKAVDRISHFVRKARWESEDSYILKVDVSKFFYSIDRDVLKRIIRKKIKCEKTLRLLDALIDSSPGEIGLPLGNLTSQLFANIYLNELDNYCKRVLKVKYYVRYADDIVILAKNKEEAVYLKEKIRIFASEVLRLSLHPEKTKVFPISQGVNAIGFKTWSTHRLLRNDCKKKVKRKIKAMPGLIEKGYMTKEKGQQMLNSWVGHAKHGNSHNFMQSLLCRSEFLTMNKRGLFILNLTEEHNVVF